MRKWFSILFIGSLAACQPEAPLSQSNTMNMDFSIGAVTYRADMSVFHDLSIPISPEGPLAWYLDHASIEVVRDDNWVGAVAEGGSVNFRNVAFNPHGHGTHTEGPGHVVPTVHSIDRAIKNYHVLAEVVTVDPTVLPDGDRVIYTEQLKRALVTPGTEAIVLRTSTQDHRKMNWSNTNPPYLDAETAEYLAEQGVKHLLIDLPSVDREVDGGRLEAHKAFWQIPDDIRMDATITELIYVPAECEDGLYLLNLQVAPFVNDAAPSRPLLYPIQAL